MHTICYTTKKDQASKYILSLAYSLGLYSFPESHSVKLIEWEKYPTKLVHTEPRWRKTNPEEPPPELPNRFAFKIMEDIKTNKTEPTPASVQKIADNFVQYSTYQNRKQQNYRSTYHNGGQGHNAQQLPHDSNQRYNLRPRNNNLQNSRRRNNRHNNHGHHQQNNHIQQNNHFQAPQNSRYFNQNNGTNYSRRPQPIIQEQQQSQQVQPLQPVQPVQRNPSPKKIVKAFT
jgi:hypothetical protein